MKSEFKPPRMRLKPWEVLYIVAGLPVLGSDRAMTAEHGQSPWHPRAAPSQASCTLAILLAEYASIDLVSIGVDMPFIRVEPIETLTSQLDKLTYRLDTPKY